MEEKIVFCKGGGCTAKLGAGVLSRVLSRLPKGPEDPNLLIGWDSRDDAAVYQISEDLAIVQTLDFFPPMVEDPYTFGQIAAAKALIDVSDAVVDAGCPLGVFNRANGELIAYARSRGKRICSDITGLLEVKT